MAMFPRRQDQSRATACLLPQDMTTPSVGLGERRRQLVGFTGGCALREDSDRNQDRDE
jgi:hypothetical protein